jgi:glycosyltransferase involved in cell wall biosynthesis
VLISIAIPAHNRPEFLLDALQSISKQTYPNFEVIVVDDGSEPPISQSSLYEVLGEQVRLHRHDLAKGVPKAKNAAVKAARGEIILLLDDDDLLRPYALESIFYAYTNYPNIDCLFLGVHPFGSYANEAAKSREKALGKIIDKLKPEEQDGLYFFSEGIFDALLNSVPIDFQRPAARRGAWNIVGGFDESSLFSESEWAIRAASICTIALTINALTEWRIHDNNFGWPPGMELDQIKRRQMENGINTGANLLKLFDEEEKSWHVRVMAVKKRQSGHLFSKAYYLRDKDWQGGIKALWSSFLLAPRRMHLKLAVKYFVPIRWIRKFYIGGKSA